MKRQEAARYARWSAGVAMLLAAITLGVYVQRGWVARRERRHAPPPAPPSVEKQSTALTFSKVEGNRTLFTVRASRSTQFRERAEDLLEDVQITIFGRNGERHDTIHTRSCQYAKDGGRISCAGEVQMELQSAADAQRAAQEPGAAAARTVHVETRGVSFDRESGVARTEQTVKFAFPDGEGQAQGLEYRSDEGLLRLEKDVLLRMQRLTPGGAGAEVNLTGASLEYRHERRIMRLGGPVRAASGAAELAAGEMTLELDANYRAQRLVAKAGAPGGARPEVRAKRPTGAGRISADELVALLDSSGALRQVQGTGQVQGEFANGTAATTLAAQHVTLEFAGRSGEPQQLTATGAVQAETRAERPGGAGETLRRLQSEAVLLKFARRGAQGGARLESAETLAPGSLAWVDRLAVTKTVDRIAATPKEGSGAGERATRLQAERIQLALQPNGRAGEALARGNVQLQRTQPGRPEETSTAREGTARFDAQGDWAEMTLRGDVQVRAGERRGQADTALFVRAAQTAQLSGNAIVSDAGTRTTARTITFYQATGEIRAEGGVRSTDLAPRGGAVQLAPVPANLSADHLQANAQTGRAVYSGHARLWQGDSVLEADRIEMLRNERVLNASGNVRAVFPQTAAAPGAAGSRAPLAGAGGPALWHVQAGTLSYREAESRARLEGRVVAQSAGQSLRAAALDLEFRRAASGGAQQLSRAVGTGGVTVAQDGRRATAERGEYSVSEGKFVLSGGNPTLYDDASGATTGRQLTFFLADDTIIVDSEKGTRTLTKHRVEK
ncbi:MAG: LptA/OstA family protein [Acidobacteriia bacterium]|nr:LptA/OstA family protein [Terriglobia bacterium]